jgi:protein-S-isoprenylcysteine O-methyltransferase Ste14
MMLFRALLSFFTLPGIFAGLVPALIVSGDHQRLPGTALGLFVLVGGICLLLVCVRDFLIAGQGTLAPWDPPQHLVIVGLYRYIRNPMYIAVILIICGWAISSGSLRLLAYALLMATIFHSRVVFGEEPELAKQFGETWDAYQKSVPRWLPRFHLLKSD